MTVQEKISVFRRYFSGLPNVYGTYDVATGRARQVKAAVTDHVLLNHLTGRQPYGVYLLVHDRTGAVAADFDHDDLGGPMAFVAACRQYGLPAYIERNKSKGYHLWMFFEESGVQARKARMVVQHILAEIGCPRTEVFPKQDSLNTTINYGNFLNAPLWGMKVPQGRTVFVDPANPTKPYPNQWGFLLRMQRVAEAQLDEIIEINGIQPSRPAAPATTATPLPILHQPTRGLPPCACRMLTEGVTTYQRVSAFRLAVNLKRTGLPQESALTVLHAWAARNTPGDGKHIITAGEIAAQVTGAYNHDYRGYGCDDPAIKPFCDPTCFMHEQRSANHSTPNHARQPTTTPV